MSREATWHEEAETSPWIRLADAGDLRAGVMRSADRFRWQLFIPYKRTLAAGEAETMEEATRQAEGALPAAAEAGG